MQGKAINIICSIGNMNLTTKAIKSLDIERNFSDVSNKFSLVLLDTPQTGLSDLELYMCAGNRAISISYNDNPDKSGFTTFKGQIWDYTSSFVGNIKQLTISGYISRTQSYDTSGVALYNIDWNNYYCLRVDTKETWNTYKMYTRTNYHHANWYVRNKNSYDTDKSKYTMENQVVVLEKDFASWYKRNAVTVKVKGPGKSIDLPVPDSFAKMEPKKDGYAGDHVDPDNLLWGTLGVIYKDPKTGETLKDEHDNPIEPPEDEVGNYDIFWVQENDHYNDSAKTPLPGKGSIRAFKLASDTTAYIQLNPTKNYYGSGFFLNSSTGVDPSYVVKQLCELEGWKYNDSTIVQTAMVPNSDSFKMNNQSALQYISEVLAPLSITPVGIYKDKSGNDVKVTQGVAGFTCWFDSNDVFHFEPLSNLYYRDKRDIIMGYNIPNSPVISFQVDTKGTCFYTTNAQQLNSIYITTGKQVTSIDVTSEVEVDSYNKVKGHNENLDNFFGYTYEEIKNKYDKADVSATNGLYLGFGNASISTDINKSKYNESLSTVLGTTDNKVSIVSSAVQKKLVTKLNSSAVASDTNIAAQLKNASKKIEQFMITATLNMWGDTRITPASIVNVINMVKSTDSDYTSKHPTSGDYLVLKQVDKISGSDFTQQLSLIRANATLYDNINPQNIDFSKGVRLDETKTEMEERIEKNQAFLKKQKERAYASSVLAPILSLWSEYLDAIKRHYNWCWWQGKSQPAIYEDMMLLSTTASTPADKSTAWYKWVNDNPDDIQVDPLVEAWYKKALSYKENGKLGTKLLHKPQTMKSCPSHVTLEYDLATTSDGGFTPPFTRPNGPTIDTSSGYPKFTYPGATGSLLGR